MTQAPNQVVRTPATSSEIRSQLPQTITVATRKRIEDAIERLMLLLEKADKDQQAGEQIHAKHRR